MASSEQADLQGFKATKYGEFVKTTLGLSGSILGQSNINDNLMLGDRRAPEIRNSGVSVRWDYLSNFTLVRYSPQYGKIGGWVETDAKLKRILNLTSSDIPTFGPPILITFDGVAAIQSGHSATIGLRVNSTAVNTNAAPLISFSSSSVRGAFYGEIWLHPHATTNYTTARGVCAHNLALYTKSLGILKSRATVVGAAAPLPNAAITSLTFTGTVSAAAKLTYITLGNVSIWKALTGVTAT